MKPRRSFKVTVLGAVPQGPVTIVIGDPHLDGAFVLVPASAMKAIARCHSAKRLAEWAFEEGAESVRHDYDLRLSDGEA